MVGVYHRDPASDLDGQWPLHEIHHAGDPLRQGPDVRRPSVGSPAVGVEPVEVKEGRHHVLESLTVGADASEHPNRRPPDDSGVGDPAANDVEALIGDGRDTARPAVAGGAMPSTTTAR